MTDYFLNLPDAETFEAIKGAIPFEYGEGGVTQSAGWNVDIIGDGQIRVVGWDAEGEPTYAPIQGFLVNLRSERLLPADLIQYQVLPTNPIRVWA